MNHLKLYESFSTDGFFTPISKEDGTDLIERKNVDLLEKTKDIILGYLNTLSQYTGDKYRGDLWISGDPESHTFVESLVKPENHYLDFNLKIDKDYINLEIVEIVDEWFIVRIHGLASKENPHTRLVTYKCDQIEGLIELLKFLTK
jgi:hypothetical protein